MTNYEELFKKDAMGIHNVSMLIRTMLEQLYRFEKRKRKYVSHNGNLGERLASIVANTMYCGGIDCNGPDDDSILFNNPVIGARHIDPMELCRPESVATVGEAAFIWNTNRFYWNNSFSEGILEDNLLYATIMARQLWDVLERSGETEEGGPWLVGTLNKALEMYGGDNPIGRMRASKELFYAKHKNGRYGCGDTIAKQELSDAFFDVYPDEEAKLADMRADGFLPWLMPWLESIGDWKVLPNGTVEFVEVMDRQWKATEFIKVLLKEVEQLVYIDDLKANDEEMLADKMKYGYYCRNIGHRISGAKYVPMFREFGSTYRTETK